MVGGASSSFLATPPFLKGLGTSPLPVTEGSSPGKLIRDLTPKWGWSRGVHPPPPKCQAPEGEPCSVRTTWHAVMLQGATPQGTEL